jgi:hypothetical protein
MMGGGISGRRGESAIGGGSSGHVRPPKAARMAAGCVAGDPLSLRPLLPHVLPCRSQSREDTSLGDPASGGEGSGGRVSRPARRRRTGPPVAPTLPRRRLLPPTADGDYGPAPAGDEGGVVR